MVEREMVALLETHKELQNGVLKVGDFHKILGLMGTNTSHLFTEKQISR